MKIVGQVVVHKAYGEGIITEVKKVDTNCYIFVNFIREIKEFAFPGIFETTIMHFKNEQVQKEFTNEYLKKKPVQPKKEITDNSDEKFIKEYNSIRPLEVRATRRAHILPTFSADLFASFGSDSGDIYSIGCQKLGWSTLYLNNFGRQGAPLFAEKATPGGYDVWFLANSNYTRNMQSERWINKISDDQEKIFELWTDRSANMDIGRDRVVFAKTTNGKYVFLGIYSALKVLRLDNGSRLRVFKRVSTTYPEQ